MKDYSTVIFALSFIWGGIMGLITWINVMSDALRYGETGSFVLTFIFGQILIPFYGIVPALSTFVLLFIVGLPIYGIYSLFKK